MLVSRAEAAIVLPVAAADLIWPVPESAPGPQTSEAGSSHGSNGFAAGALGVPHVPPGVSEPASSHASNPQNYN